MKLLIRNLARRTYLLLRLIKTYIELSDATILSLNPDSIKKILISFSLFSVKNLTIIPFALQGAKQDDRKQAKNEAKKQAKQEAGREAKRAAKTQAKQEAKKEASREAKKEARKQAMNR